MLDLDWTDYVIQDPHLFRAAEVTHLLGDPSKAKRVLGWTPKHNFDWLVEHMVKAEL
jgi:GDPmannose 4,6-dehydratase